MAKGGQCVLSVTRKKQDLVSNELKKTQQFKHLEKDDTEKVKTIVSKELAL